MIDDPNHSISICLSDEGQKSEKWIKVKMKDSKKKQSTHKQLTDDWILI